MRTSSALRSTLISVVFLAVIVAGLSAGEATASPSTQSTVPPVADAAPYGVYLPQIVAVDQSGTDSIVEDINEEEPDENDDVTDPDKENVTEDPVGGCPTTSNAVYTSLPVVGLPADRPPPIHADLNLAVRSYVTTTAPLTLVDINGPTDGDAPNLAGIVSSAGTPSFVQAYSVNTWDWTCQGDEGMPWHGHGCRGAPITYPPVTLLALATEPSAPVRTPARNAEIHAGGYIALVLYAEEKRITLVYTREDTVAHGYAVHLEDVCVDPALLSLYRQLDAAGRSWLPALHSLETLGTGSSLPVKVAIRDTGSFMDPRSRKDWWKGY